MENNLLPHLFCRCIRSGTLQVPVTIPGIKDKTFSIPLIPLLIFLLHCVVFSITFPLLDLPHADDANYFGYGKLFARQGDYLQSDWSPILTYVVAVLHICVPLSWYGLFTIYSFICRLLLLWGIYAFIARFTSGRWWAFFSTLLAAVFFSYWVQMNGRAFTNGAFLLILGWFGPKRSLGFLSAMAFISISYLLRPEFVLVAGGFCLYAVWAQFRQSSWKGVFSLSRSGAILCAVAFILWFPFFFTGRLNTNRLIFAFSQSFQNYVIEEGFSERAGLEWSSDWNQTVETFFPPEKRNLESFPGRFIPLYDIASSNPEMFWRFVWHNAKAFVGLEFTLSESSALSKLLNFYMAFSFLFWIVFTVWSGKWRENILFLYLSVILILSIVSCLITRPIGDYIVPMVVWCSFIIPFHVWEKVQIRLSILAIAGVVALSLQIPEWKNIVNEQRSMKNWNRARLLETASHDEPILNSIIAEPYPVFCVAFNDEIKQSVHYQLQWDNTGKLRAYWDQGPVVDYVLLEAAPPKHLLLQKKELSEWMKKWGRKVAESNGFSLWKVQQHITAPPGCVIVTDDEFSSEDISNRTDEDPADGKDLVIRWNFENKEMRDFHIYVSQDERKYQYLGRAGNPEANRFIWDLENRLIAPEYQNGPEFGHRYRFRVFGIPVENSPDKPDVLETKGSVLFSSGKSFPPSR